MKLSANLNLKSTFPKSVPFNLYIRLLQSPVEWAGLLTDQIVTINDSNPGLHQKTLKNEYCAYFTMYDFSFHIVVCCSEHDCAVSGTLCPLPNRAHWRQCSLCTNTLPSPFNLPSTSSPPAYMDCMVYQSLEMTSVTALAQSSHSISSL